MELKATEKILESSADPYEVTSEDEESPYPDIRGLYTIKPMGKCLICYGPCSKEHQLCYHTCCPFEIQCLSCGTNLGVSILPKGKKELCGDENCLKIYRATQRYKKRKSNEG